MGKTQTLLRGILAASIAVSAPCFAQAATPLGPTVDHHQHLLSPAASALLAAPETHEQVPAEVADLLKKRVLSWNTPAELASLYADNALLMERDEVLHGRDDVSRFVGTRFAAPYDIKVVDYSEAGSTRELAVLYTRGSGAELKNVATGVITLARDSNGRWLIVSEALNVPAPGSYAPLDAAKLVKLLDDADIQKAVVLSIAYMFESPSFGDKKDGAAKLRAENDWTAAQVARFPSRLVGFCSVNPLTETAIPEIERCKRVLHMTGLKLHLGNSRVDFQNRDQIARVRRAFALANALRLPIVVHLWNGPSYGARDAQVVLDQLLPAAPDVVVQIAHLGGGGPGWTDDALQLFLDAIERHDPRMRRVYFDVATVADEQTHDQLELLAKRLREAGLNRILYGSDSAFGDHKTPDEEWGTFRGMVPLTDAEFAVIRDNVVPYLRPAETRETNSNEH